MRGLYDWLRSKTPAPERTRHVELTPPVARYEQVARQLRERIIGGEFPEESTLPSGPDLADQLGVSQPVVQRAFEVLGRDGLVRMVPGRGTTVVRRQRWRVEIELSGDAGIEGLGVLRARADAHAAVSGFSGAEDRNSIRLRMTVEASDAGYAGTVAAGLAREALGSLVITSVSTAQG